MSQTPTLRVDPDATAGSAAIRAAAAAGVQSLFTLSGAHVFPLYDAAYRGARPLRMIDVRHEASAVFAAEAVGKLTRTPGFAVVTAGPGVTNAVSPVTQAYFNGAPLVLFGGRAPEFTWGRGALQELDQAPIFAPITKAAHTVREGERVGQVTATAFEEARTAHRGPVFVEAGIDVLCGPASATPEAPTARPRRQVGDLDQIAALIRAAKRPIIVVGGDVWSDGAERAMLELVEKLDLPAVTNGMGRGVVPGGHPSCASRARGRAFGQCDLAIVVGTPLDFRLGYGSFGPPAAPADVVHIADSPTQLATHRELAGSAAGDLTDILITLSELVGSPGDWSDWRSAVSAASHAAFVADTDALTADRDPIHPARVYGELLPRLGDDTIVIGDGGDFVSWAGRFIQPARPGRWLDPGPFGCLGAGLGAAIGARVADPDSPIVLLLGDGAAGMSLMDIDTLVRHQLPVVIVVGNNSAWGLEKGPMRMIYGYDVLADLAPHTRYDEVARALGGAAELVARPRDIGPALDRGLASGTPYLINVLLDSEAAYPRSTTGL